VRVLSRAERDAWLESLEAARVERNPDLTTAATVCQQSLESISEALSLGTPGEGSGGAEWLGETYEHLVAHCRAVLGS
jgi:hypothetical protein